MLLADTNIWLALAISKHQFHGAARTWISGVKTTQKVAFCRATQQSFLRLLTTHAVITPYGIPTLTNEEAWDTYNEFLADPRITWASEPKGIDALWKQFAARPLSSPKLWMDAYLAAFAFSRGDQLVTTDKAFSQFAGLNVIIL